MSLSAHYTSLLKVFNDKLFIQIIFLINSKRAGDTNKRSGLQKLELWLKDNKGPEICDDTLLEDSLSPLKCSFATSCFSK